MARSKEEIVEMVEEIAEDAERLAEALPEEVKTPLRQRILALIKNPNRVALYMTALGDLIAALLIILADLQVEEVVTVLTLVAAVNAKVLSWLKGWQKMESAEYQARLISMQHASEAELVAAASKVPSGRVRLPR